jgi:hypothetical protein
VGPTVRTGILAMGTLGISTSLVTPLDTSILIETGRDRGDGVGTISW